jgi:hypothetical protein
MLFDRVATGRYFWMTLLLPEVRRQQIPTMDPSGVLRWLITSSPQWRKNAQE